MADSQVRAALLDLGASVRADFQQVLTAWQADWLSSAHAIDDTGLALDDLAQDLARTQEPLGGMLDLHRFLTTGFLPGAEVTDAEPVGAAPTHRDGRPAAQGPAPAAQPGADHEPQPSRLPNGRPHRAGVTTAATPVPAPDPASNLARVGGLHDLAHQWQTVDTSPVRPTDAPEYLAGSTRTGGLRELAQRLPADANPPPQTSGAAHAPRPATAQPEEHVSGQRPTPVRTGGLRDLAQRLPADASPPRQQTVRQVEDAPGARPWLTAGDERPEGTTLLPAAHREVTAPAALAPVALPASIAPASHVPHGQLPGAAPLTSLPPVYAAPPLDTLMDALAREITREYHRFYGV